MSISPMTSDLTDNHWATEMSQRSLLFIFRWQTQTSSNRTVSVNVASTISSTVNTARLHLPYRNPCVWKWLGGFRIHLTRLSPFLGNHESSTIEASVKLWQDRPTLSGLNPLLLLALKHPNVSSQMMFIYPYVLTNVSFLGNLVVLWLKNIIWLALYANVIAVLSIPRSHKIEQCIFFCSHID